MQEIIYTFNIFKKQTFIVNIWIMLIPKLQTNYNVYGGKFTTQHHITHKWQNVEIFLNIFSEKHHMHIYNI